MVTGDRARSLLPDGLLMAAGGEDALDDDSLSFAALFMVAAHAEGVLPSQGAGHARVESSRGAEAAAQLGPWVRQQPRPADLAGLPVVWDDSEMEALGVGSALASKTRALRRRWASEHEGVAAWWGEGAPAAGDWVWARCCARSRVFLDGLDEGGLFGGGGMGEEDEEGEGGAAGAAASASKAAAGDDDDELAGLGRASASIGLVMVPLADMLNHSAADPMADEDLDETMDAWEAAGHDAGGVTPAHEVRWSDGDDGEGCFEVVAVLPVARGDQLCISYCREFLEALDTYGFVPVSSAGPPSAVGMTTAGAVLSLLGPAVSSLEESVPLLPLSVLDRLVCRKAPGVDPAEAPGLEARADVMALLGAVPPREAEAGSDKHGAGSGVSDAGCVSVPCLRAGTPQEALLVLQAACAATPADLRAVVPGDGGGADTAGGVGLVTRRRAFEALGRLCSHFAGGLEATEPGVVSLARLVMEGGLSGRRLAAAQCRLARAYVCWSGCVVAKLGLAACAGDADGVEVAMREASGAGARQPARDWLQETAWDIAALRDAAARGEE